MFAAARRAGIRNIVWASSETVLGLPFDTPPPYVPVDEEYPPRPETHLLAGQDPRGGDGPPVLPLGPRAEDDRAALLQRDGPRGLRRFPAFDADPRLRKWNLWAYIDARDGAQAVRQALELPARASDVFIIANADTVMTRPSAELVAEVFPGVEVARELGEHETLLSIDKARRVLGYDPQHSWRDQGQRAAW